MTIYPALEIPDTLVVGPSPNHINPHVLEKLQTVDDANHMQQDVLRGMVEAKHMLREVFGTQNIHTFGVGGSGFSGLDCMLSLVLPGDKIVVFVNGMFSDLDSLTIRMKASTPADLAANPMNPQPDNVVIVNVPHGEPVTGDIVTSALAEHQPMWAFMAHRENGSERINDIKGFNDACAEHEVMGMVDAVSSLGIDDFDIDEYPGVVAWASCPQKGVLSLPMTYAPVSFRYEAIELIKQRGCYTYVHHPVLEARHWGIIDGEDVEAGTYHRTHSPYAIAAFHEALRILLSYGRKQQVEEVCQ